MVWQVPSGLPDPFSLADPSTVTEILEGAGFADVTFTDVSEPVYYGPDVDAAMDWVRGFACTSEVLKRLDPTPRSMHSVGCVWRSPSLTA